MFDLFRRKKLRRQTNVHFSEYMIIDNYKISAVNLLTPNIEEKQELDFYLDTGYDIYLLRLINNLDNHITIIPTSKICNIIYIVAELPYNSKKLTEYLKIVVVQLKKIELPEIKNRADTIAIT